MSGKSKTAHLGKNFKGIIDRTDSTELSGNVRVYHFPAGGTGAGVGAYFLNMYTDLEYEYLYLDKELSVDKIMAKSKRKRVGTYSLDRMEVFAPVYSYHLDNFKNRQVKEKDYSIGEVLQPDGRYAMYYEGGEKILLSPNEELVKVLKNMAPRKVFSE